MRVLAFVMLLLGCATSGPIELPSIGPGDAGYKLTGDIMSQSSEVAAYVERQEVRHSAVTIEIDSLGGSAYEGIAIYDAIRAAQVPSVCLVNGKAASAAFLVLQACTSRRMTHTSLLGTHHPSIIIPEPTEFTVEAFRRIADGLTSLTATWDTMIVRRLDMPPADYERKVADGELWIMNADQAIDANAVDVVIDGSREFSLP